MKRRFYALMLVVAMLAMTLVGCGSDTTNTTNTTNDVAVNTETEESGEDAVVEPTEDPVVEPTMEPEVEDPMVEPTEEPTTEEEFYSDSYQWTFPEGMDGFTDKFVLASDETMSFNCTHYVDTNGNEMNFSWVGPTELGERAGAGDKTLSLYGGDDYELRAWTYGYVDGDYESCLEMDKATWVGFADDEIPYVDNGYYNVEITEDIIKVVFAVENDNYKGYNYYITDSTNSICYQFAYFERSDIYDDARAMNVINSIEYWTYNPGEIVTE